MYGLAGLALAVVAIVWLTLAARARIAGASARRRARKRSRRAIAGETRAETVLEARGYVIEARQARCQWQIHGNDEVHDIQLRADLLVSRRGYRYVAEVKTGAKAPKLTTSATRRQLLEYRVAYPDIDGVLLVDAEADHVVAVSFPGIDEALAHAHDTADAPMPWLRLLLVFGAGVATGVLAL